MGCDGRWWEVMQGLVVASSINIPAYNAKFGVEY